MDHVDSGLAPRRRVGASSGGHASRGVECLIRCIPGCRGVRRCFVLIAGFRVDTAVDLFVVFTLRCARGWAQDDEDEWAYESGFPARAGIGRFGMDSTQPPYGRGFSDLLCSASLRFRDLEILCWFPCWG